jgi:hypothetical protein
MGNSGTLVSIVEQQAFDFSFLASGATQTQVLARAINVIPYGRLSLVTRVHVNGLGGSTSMDVFVTSTYPSDKDQVSFTNTTLQITRNIVPGDNAGTMHVDLANDLGPWVQVSIRGNQHATLATRVQAQLSIAILLRESGI